MTALAGDIGGTKTILALFTGEKEGMRLIREAVYPSRLCPDLEGGKR
ncbi:MAG: glucokinase [Candidatus Manganitrophus sp. SB1]|nr:glucokinase [Candidatus Manganitrophus morganii]